VFVGALFAGALITYPLHLLVSLFTQHEFSDLVIRATQICGLLFSLLYLRYACSLSLETIGLKIRPGQLLPQLSYSFMAGLLILVLLSVGLLSFGIYDFHSYREINASAIGKLVISAIITGMAVAMFEETVFRGALQQGLTKKTGAVTALVTISIIYAAVHFIDYREPETIGWLTAPQQFWTAYSHLVTPDNIDAFFSLFALGLLLGLIRLRSGNIIQCIGLHAGLVAGIKLFRFFFEYNPANEHGYLVSSYDYRLGYMALMLIGLITIAYYLYPFNKQTSLVDKSPG